MKKILTLLPIVALLAACGTTDPYGKRDQDIKKSELKDRERNISEMPEWMTKIPASDAAKFAAASGEAETINAAISIARNNAFTALCMTDGGTIDSQSKQFETANSKSSNYESVTRTKCKAIEVTGYEIYSTKSIGKNPVVVPTSTGYTAYLLVALPTGKANPLRQAKEQEKREVRESARAVEAFKELDKPQ
jgi:hypothetical protein